MQALDVVDAALKDIIRKLSSFDRYKGEVFSGNLDWSPMHKDPVFWRENISKFEESDFQVLLDVFNVVLFLPYSSPSLSLWLTPSLANKIAIDTYTQIYIRVHVHSTLSFLMNRTKFLARS